MKKISEIITSDQYLDGRFFGTGVVRRTILDPCTHKKATHFLKLIPTNRQDPFWPKYIPQIKKCCKDCGKYLKFAEQTPELIAKCNQALEGFECV